MKALKIFILSIGLLVSGQSYADMRDATDSWLQGGPSRALGLTQDEEADGELTTSEAPVHDGVYVLLALAGVYMIARKRKSISLQNPKD